jgi:hypothetical protein
MRSINALAYTDSEVASQLLNELATSGTSARIRTRAADAKRISDVVRSRGLKYQWDSESNRASH